jgi:Bacterial PH domain
MQPEQGQGRELPNGGANGHLAGQAIAASQPVGPAMLPGDGPKPATASGPKPATASVPEPTAQSTPQPGATAVSQPEQKTFRLPGALVAWWVWLIFAAACLLDILISGRNHLAAEIAVALFFITGLVYACALWPRVVTDSAAITVRNPLRDHRIPWGSVAAVDLRESVQVHCVQEPGAKRGKIIYSWALYAQRRNRMRQQLQAQGDDRRRLPRSALTTYGAPQDSAEKISRQSAAKIMATQLDEMAKEAREQGAAAGPRIVRWSWQPALAMIVPGIALILVITVFH